MPNTEVCDLCGRDELKPIYPVPGTARGLVVNVCMHCGLAQSLPRIDHVARRSAFPVSGAGFGNIRYGKGFRTDFALKTIASQRSLSAFNRCLDVGANRGSFILALKKAAPQIVIDAVEPDERVTGDYENVQDITLIPSRIEHVTLQADTYDLVYHCHTLEHEKHPLKSLTAIQKAMTDEGLMFLEVPNIALLERDDLVEEWFIDKHLYHYSAHSLLQTLKAAGFEVIWGPDASDETNLSVLVKKSGAQSPRGDQSLASKEVGRISDYGVSLLENQHRLKDGAGRLSSFCQDNSVVIWGAGRIFTSLVDIGGFGPNQLSGLVDRNLHRYVDSMYGIDVLPPEAIAEIRPETVLVASRLYLDEIKTELSSILEGVNVLTLDDVLAGDIEG